MKRELTERSCRREVDGEKLNGDKLKGEKLKGEKLKLKGEK